jgi:hypothetical protein
MSRRPKRTFIEGRTISKIKRRTERTSCGWKNLDRTEGKYLSTINYTSKPLLRQTSAVVSKQRTENSNPIPNSCIPSPVSCLLSPVSTRKLILHDYLARWIEKETGREKVWNQRGWDYLKKSRYSCQKPRAKHKKGDSVE